MKLYALNENDKEVFRTLSEDLKNNAGGRTPQVQGRTDRLFMGEGTGSTAYEFYVSDPEAIDPDADPVVYRSTVSVGYYYAGLLGYATSQTVITYPTTGQDNAVENGTGYIVFEVWNTASGSTPSYSYRIYFDDERPTQADKDVDGTNYPVYREQLHKVVFEAYKPIAMIRQVNAPVHVKGRVV